MTRRGWLPLSILLLVLALPAPALAASADLAVSMTHSATLVGEGAEVDYHVTVTNNGPGDADADVTLSVSSILDLASVHASQGTVLTNDDGHLVTAQFGTVASGDSATIDFAFSAEHPGTGTANATASLPSGDDSDPNSGNNTTSAGITVTGLSVDPSPAFGDVAAGTLSPPRTFTVTNGTNGPVTINSIVRTGDMFDLFRFPDDNCSSGPTLAQGGTCHFTLRFAPGGLGDRVQTWTFGTNVSSVDPLVMPFTARGVALPTSQGQQGPQGPEGPAGPAAFKLVVVAAQSKLSSRAGHRVSLTYASTLDANVTLDVLRGAKTVASMKGTAQQGRNAIRWNGKTGKKAAKPGRYVLRLTATNGTQRVSDSARLTVRRAHR